jgi:hypothetical protein
MEHCHYLNISPLLLSFVGVEKTDSFAIRSGSNSAFTSLANKYAPDLGYMFYIIEISKIVLDVHQTSSYRGHCESERPSIVQGETKKYLRLSYDYGVTPTPRYVLLINRNIVSLSQ